MNRHYDPSLDQLKTALIGRSIIKTHLSGDDEILTLDNGTRITIGGTESSWGGEGGSSVEIIVQTANAITDVRYRGPDNVTEIHVLADARWTGLVRITEHDDPSGYYAGGWWIEIQHPEHMTRPRKDHE